MTAVVVDEAKVLSTLRGGTWWRLWRTAPEHAGRVQAASPLGDRVTVMCDDDGDARALARMFTDRGLPETAVSVAA